LFLLVRIPSKTGAKVFFFKDQIVKLSAKAHSEPLNEHHERDNTSCIQDVNTQMLFYFKPTQAGTMPACK
jgi:hypothetical protein